MACGAMLAGGAVFGVITTLAPAVSLPTATGTTPNPTATATAGGLGDEEITYPASPAPVVSAWPTPIASGPAEMSPSAAPSPTPASPSATTTARPSAESSASPAAKTQRPLRDGFRCDGPIGIGAGTTPACDTHSDEARSADAGSGSAADHVRRRLAGSEPACRSEHDRAPAADVPGEGAGDRGLLTEQRVSRDGRPARDRAVGDRGHRDLVGAGEWRLPVLAGVPWSVTGQPGARS